jgi:hypothetical protein
MMSLIPLGQLYARVKIFNGSLDKWWLMFPLFLIPPLSFIPMLLMKFGFISDGKGTNPLDYWMYLPIIVKFTLGFLLPIIIDEDSETLTMVVSLVIQLISVMIANLARRYMNCQQNITVDSIGKATIDSTIALGMGEISSFVIPWLPFIGIFISLIELIPVIGQFVDTILWSIGFLGAYVLINMFNQDDLDKFCSTPFTGNLQDRIPFIISLIAIIGTRIFSGLF